MTRLAIVLLFFTLFLRNAVLAQDMAYRGVDSIMRQYYEKIKSADELYKVVYFIRNTFKIDSLRLRASFIWIIENIAYDIEGYQKEDPRASTLNYVIKNKKAVCGGYAALLKFFCDAFNLESEIIYGIARANKKRDVNIAQYNLRSNHAWNAVKINDNWRLLDPTWAAGSVDDTDEENLKYIKDYREEYYFTSPDRMIYNHFPNNFKFQFLSMTIPKEKFRKWPMFTTQFIRDSISTIYPDTALVKGKVGDTIFFRIKTKFNPAKIYLKSEMFEKADYTDTGKRNGEWLEFHYPLKVSGNYVIFLGFESSIYRIHPFVAYKFEVNRSGN